MKNGEGKYQKLLGGKVINGQRPQIIKLLSLLDKHFRVDNLFMLHEIRVKVVEWKIGFISKEIETIKCNNILGIKLK